MTPDRPGHLLVSHCKAADRVQHQHNHQTAQRRWQTAEALHGLASDTVRFLFMLWTAIVELRRAQTPHSMDCEATKDVGSESEGGRSASSTCHRAARSDFATATDGGGRGGAGGGSAELFGSRGGEQGAQRALLRYHRRSIRHRRAGFLSFAGVDHIREADRQLAAGLHSDQQSDIIHDEGRSR